ncbi:MAG TPA: hypothetical protein VMW42_02180 [Desulfatiglandales bacterium]|nr:hypothetical protein [Desulfatiglandales bacterium]
MHLSIPALKAGHYGVRGKGYKYVRAINEQYDWDSLALLFLFLESSAHAPLDNTEKQAVGGLILHGILLVLLALGLKRVNLLTEGKK